MSSPVTLNLRTSIRKSKRDGAPHVSATQAEIIPGEADWSAEATQPHPASSPRLAEAVRGHIQNLSTAHTLAEQVSLMSQLLARDDEASSMVVVGLLTSLPTASSLLNQIRKALAKRRPASTALRQAVAGRLGTSGDLGPPLCRCLELSETTKAICLADDLRADLLGSVLKACLVQSTDRTSCLRALVILTSGGDTGGVTAPWADLQSLLHLAHRSAWAMDHTFSACLVVSRCLWRPELDLNGWMEQCAQPGPENPTLSLCLVHAFTLTCDRLSLQRESTHILARTQRMAESEIGGVLLLQVSRLTLQFIRRMKAERPLLTSDPWIRAVEQLIWLQFESSVETVRHNTCNALNHLIETLLEGEAGNPELSRLIRTILDMRPSKGKCLALLQVVKVVPWAQFEAHSATRRIQAELSDLLHDKSVRNFALDVYERMAHQASQGCGDIRAWGQQWVPPILEQSHLPEVERLIGKLWQFGPEYFDSLGEQECPTDASLKEQNLLLIIIKSKKNTRKPYRDFLEIPGFTAALGSFHDQIRLLALDCLLTSRSSAEQFTERELKAILTMTRENVHLESNWSKERHLSLTKKCLQRLAESWMALEKSSSDSVVALYSNFLDDHRQILVQCLFEGAKSSRRVIALESLALMRSILSRDKVPVHAQEGPTLVQVLADSFETNKKLALELLQDFESHDLGLDTLEGAQSLWTRCIQMRQSPNPAQSLEAAYLTRLLIRQSGFQELCRHGSLPDRLWAELEEHVSIARKSLSRAAQSRPIYGVLMSMRMLLDASWVDLDPMFASLVEINTLILPILESDAPEGSTLDEDDDDAQALLLCAWRTSKEISLLMNHLARRSDESGVRRVFRFLCESLSVLKHRGAFEQAHFAFSALCQDLVSTSSSMKGWVDAELKAILATIDQGQDVLCSTRRSAGIPFLILSLVAARKKDTQMESLNLVMNSLFQSAHNLTDAFPVSSRVNAFHILRNLFRSNVFATQMALFSEQGLRVAIEGFHSHLWEIRNAATLLFSTLVTRIFGVKKDRDEFSGRNAMTTRMFFLRHPKLFALFQSHLEALDQVLAQGQGSFYPEESAMVAIMVILAKLKSSPISTGPDPFQVQGWMPLLYRCCRSSIQRLRELSSRCVVKLSDLPVKELTTATHRDNSHPSWLLQFLTEPYGRQWKARANQVHGNLLIIEHFLRSLSDTDEAKIRKFWVRTLLSHQSVHLQEVLEQSPSSYWLKCSVVQILTLAHSLAPESFLDHPGSVSLMALIWTDLIAQSSSPGSLNPGRAIFQSTALDLMTHVSLRQNSRTHDLIGLLQNPGAKTTEIILGRMRTLSYEAATVPCVREAFHTLRTHVLALLDGVEVARDVFSVLLYYLKSEPGTEDIQLMARFVTQCIDEYLGQQMEIPELFITSISTLVPLDEAMWASFLEVSLTWVLDSGFTGEEEIAQELLASLLTLVERHPQALSDWSDSRLWYIVLVLSYHEAEDVRLAVLPIYLHLGKDEVACPPSQLASRLIRNFGTQAMSTAILQAVTSLFCHLRLAGQPVVGSDEDRRIFDPSVTSGGSWLERKIIAEDLLQATSSWLPESDLDVPTDQIFNREGIDWLCSSPSVKSGAILTWMSGEVSSRIRHEK